MRLFRRGRDEGAPPDDTASGWVSGTRADGPAIAVARPADVEADAGPEATEAPLPHAPPPARVKFLDILRIREIRVVIFGTFVIMLGYGILSPALPLYARSFHVGYDAVGVLIAAFAFTRLLFDLVTGPLVDRFGERAMVTFGAVVVGVSSILAAVAPTFALLVVFRGAGGAGSAVFFAALMSYLLRTSPKELMGRVMGVFYGAFNLGIIMGQPIGGAVAHVFGLASPLWVYAFACFASAGLYVRYVRDPDRPAEEGPAVHGLRSLRWDRKFVAMLVANGAYFWMVAAVWTTLGALFGKERVGLSTVGVGLALAVASVTEFAVLFPAGALTDRRGRKAVLIPSFVALVVVVGLFGLADSVLTFVIALGLLGVASGFGGVPIPVLLSDVVPPEKKPVAIGVYRFVGDLGFVLGPLMAGGAASAFGFTAAFALSALPIVLALGFLLAIPETMPARRPAGPP